MTMKKWVSLSKTSREKKGKKNSPILLPAAALLFVVGGLLIPFSLSFPLRCSLLSYPSLICGRP